MTFFELVRSSLLLESSRMRAPGRLLQTVIEALRQQNLKEQPKEHISPD